MFVVDGVCRIVTRSTPLPRRDRDARTKRRLDRPLHFTEDIMLGAITLTLAATTLVDTHALTEALPAIERPTRLRTLLEERTPHWNAVTRERVAEAIEGASARHEIDPALVLAIITTESRFRTRAKSSVGAIGLMQLLPATAESFARRAGVKWRGPKTLEHPIHNVRIGIEYLAWLLDRFDGEVDHAVAAYCYGPMRIRRILDARALGRTEYTRRVNAAYAALKPYFEVEAEPQPHPAALAAVDATTTDRFVSKPLLGRYVEALPPEARSTHFLPAIDGA